MCSKSLKAYCDDADRGQLSSLFCKWSIIQSCEREVDAGFSRLGTEASLRPGLKFRQEGTASRGTLAPL